MKLEDECCSKEQTYVLVAGVGKNNNGEAGERGCETSPGDDMNRPTVGESIAFEEMP